MTKYTLKDALIDLFCPSKADYSIEYNKKTQRTEIITREMREEAKAQAKANKEQVKLYEKTMSWENLTGTKKYKIDFFPEVVRNEIGAYIYAHREEFPPERLKVLRKELKKAWNDCTDKYYHNLGHIFCSDDDLIMQECAIARAILGGMTYAEYKEKSGINPAKDYGNKAGGDGEKWWIVTHMLLNKVDIKELFGNKSIMNRHFLTREIPADGLMCIYEAHMNGYDDVIKAITSRMSNDKLGLLLHNSSVRAALRDGIDLDRILKRIGVRDGDFNGIGDHVHHAILAGVKEDDIVRMFRNDPSIKSYSDAGVQAKFLELEQNRV